MYCPKCKCEYTGWKDTCPVCQTPLLAAAPKTLPHTSAEPLDYEDLVALVRDGGGQLRLKVSVTDVAKHQKKGFPYRGYGYAWARRMQGGDESLSVDLAVKEAARDDGYSFPYFGHGYAWVKTLAGEVGGNAITLQASKVNRKRTYEFPYNGYGYAAAEAFSGHCGDQLSARLAITHAGRNKGWTFPYFGFGYAWEEEGELVLESEESQES